MVHLDNSNDYVAQTAVRIKMTIENQALKSSNAGMRYFANIKGSMIEVTHLAKSTDATNEILKQLDAEIAYTIIDANSGNVVANFMGATRTGNVAYSGEHAKDMSTEKLAFTPLYGETDGGLYQVQTLALDSGLVNDIMALHEDLALIDTIAATDETPEIFVIASTRRGYKA